MYYSTVDDGGFETCMFEENKSITMQLPSDSDKLFPENSNQRRFIASDDYRHRNHQQIVRPEQLMD